MAKSEGLIRKVMEFTDKRAEIWLRAGSRGSNGWCDWLTDSHDIRANWIASFEYPDGSDNALAFCDDCLERLRELYPEAEAQ